ncbi:hypothetical protein [Streptomyces lasiicapitis]|uniref:hypothetical protein n=1 Tax=Streptomyces lasiicapitis TaxID=1923961 RepID=UPI003660B3CF
MTQGWARADVGVPKVTTGWTRTRGRPGRKRGLAVDVLELITGVVVSAASADGSSAGKALLDQAAMRCV